MRLSIVGVKNQLSKTTVVWVVFCFLISLGGGWPINCGPLTYVEAVAKAVIQD